MSDELVSDSGWWWLSFCDPARAQGDQFLGACIVEGRTIPDAVRQAWRVGSNPGGEVMATAVDAASLSRWGDEWRNRLLTREDCAKL